MPAPALLLVVEEAFAVRGGAVQLSPRITIAQDAPRAHFGVRLLHLPPNDVPPGTEIWREDP